MKPRKMKSLRYPCTREQSEDIRRKQRLCKEKSITNAAENWMAPILAKTGKKWTRQAMWGYRIFDFWCAEIGVAVEVDGATHKIDYDNYRDEYNYRRSGIIVLRVPNFCEESAKLALAVIASAETWKERRLKMGIFGNKRQKRRLVSEPTTGKGVESCVTD